ncbi:MAG: hypothetical protein V4685_05720 [Bacteroidota bacterium]
MKQSTIIVVSLILLSGTCFTFLHSSKAAVKNNTYCCKKKGGQREEKKVAAPLPYMPMVNIL